MFDEFEQPAQHKPRKEQDAAVPSKQLIGLHVMLCLGYLPNTLHTILRVPDGASKTMYSAA